MTEPAVLPTPTPAPVPAPTPTPSGARWLASARCGTDFDVISAPGLFGRRVLEQLWSAGPGRGPVAAYRGRLLLFAAPGTAARLPALLRWEEWSRGTRLIPPLLCHGVGDVVTVPEGTTAADGHWLVAPESRHPWLPGPEVLLWACVRAAREGAGWGREEAIFADDRRGANVYDVSRRR
ncbi:hypothetical protein ACWD33_03270 [Streptomyces xiamenensis]|uniref:hypothetical protein n=1 Tax=Streptomyces TaxID=1883 RepID=UPI000A7EE7B2